MHTPTATRMTTATDQRQLSLLWLASPALPIGGFSYSEGLEAAVHAGWVHDEPSASDWLSGQLALSQARADLAVIAAALAACRAGDGPRLQALDEWVRQTRETAELRLQTEQMGRSLMEWLRSLDADAAVLPLWPAAWRSPTYPVAYALALHHRLGADAPWPQAQRDALLTAAFAWAENMVQAAIKAVPLGQSAGQRIIARLCQDIPAAIDAALAATDATRQSFAPMLAILSARHETQYSRLFRS
ncbi:urease accessory protein [Tepidicella xavieri]|uniref:Urease accessory protein UreF n=2 Tax=Tepidicella xavieri TaxID=360241 RepID=A0A4R6UE11_9BURK|nr:urease accessory protein [Tepidicella xavieri]